MTKMIGYVALAATALFATSALADGMPTARGVQIAAAAPTAQCSAAAWNGLYAGAQVGTATLYSQTAFEDVLGIATRHDDTGLLVGGQIGYNWARCNSLMGIEADFAWSNVESNGGLNLGGIYPGGGSQFSNKVEMNWFSTIRARAGITVDNMLLYVTGGVAFADIKHSGATTLDFSNQECWANCRSNASYNDSDTRWGFVVGGGVEYKLSDRISVKSEALYTKLEDRNFRYDLSPLAGPGVGLNLKAHDDLFIARMGINFKIGDRAAEAYEPLK